MNKTEIKFITSAPERHHKTAKVPVTLLGPHLVQPCHLHPQSAMGKFILATLGLNCPALHRILFSRWGTWIPTKSLAKVAMLQNNLGWFDRHCMIQVTMQTDPTVLRVTWNTPILLSTTLQSMNTAVCGSGTLQQKHVSQYKTVDGFSIVFQYPAVSIHTSLYTLTFVSERHHNTAKVLVPLLGPHLVQPQDARP